MTEDKFRNDYRIHRNALVGIRNVLVVMVARWGTWSGGGGGGGGSSDPYGRETAHLGSQ